MPTPLSPKQAISGFKHAQDGILHCFRTQKHMRFHFFVLVFTLFSGLLLNLDNRDMLVLIFAITLVIVAEMFNTAIEIVVDMVNPSYNPAAKLAKDVAAGGVLLAAMNALVAGVIIFFSQNQLVIIQQRMHNSIAPDFKDTVVRVLVLSIVLLTLIVIISKLLSDTGSPWHGGIISGHSAIGFALAMTIFFIAHDSVVAWLAITLALLVAQSRVEARVHSVREVVLGAVLAIFLTSLLYRVMPYVWKTLLPGSRTAVQHSLPGTQKGRRTSTLV